MSPSVSTGFDVKKGSVRGALPWTQKFEGSGKDGCASQWFPNPLAQSWIGRDWRKMIRVSMWLCEESSKSCFRKFCLKCTPSGMVIGITFVARSVSLESTTATKNVILISVYRQLFNDMERLVKEDKKLNLVVEATISHHKFTILEGIQGEFLYALVLKFINEETALGIVIFF